jgi:hypothetical protein
VLFICGSSLPAGRSGFFPPDPLLLPFDFQPFLADHEIAAIDDLGDNVGAVTVFELDQTGFTVLYLIESRRLFGVCLDIGEALIVKYRCDQEGFLVGREAVAELHVYRIARNELAGSSLNLPLGFLPGLASLGFGYRYLLLVVFNLAGRYKPWCRLHCGHHRLFLRFDEHLEVWLCPRRLRDFREHE